jgi:hypothetical protein
MWILAAGKIWKNFFLLFKLNDQMALVRTTKGATFFACILYVDDCLWSAKNEALGIPDFANSQTPSPWRGRQPQQERHEETRRSLRYRISKMNVVLNNLSLSSP